MMKCGRASPTTHSDAPLVGLLVPLQAAAREAALAARCEKLEGGARSAAADARARTEAAEAARLVLQAALEEARGVSSCGSLTAAPPAAPSATADSNRKEVRLSSCTSTHLGT